MSKLLEGKRVLVTGVGLRPVVKFNRPGERIDANYDEITNFPGDSTSFKKNIGATTATECFKSGAIVHMVARTEKNLKRLKSCMEFNKPNERIEYTVADLSSDAGVHYLLDRLPRDPPLYWIQSVGVGAGSVKLPNDNPYLPIEEISTEHMEAELSVAKDTLRLFKALLPRFKAQSETRICIVSSMSAVRSYPLGVMHCAAKAAMHGLTNAAMLELNQHHIQITEIRPGIVNTGLYDSSEVQLAMQKAGASYGYDYSNDVPLMPPSAVGKAIVMALTSEAHITSINMVARGQWPHEGS